MPRGDWVAALPPLSHTHPDAALLSLPPLALPPALALHDFSSSSCSSDSDRGAPRTPRLTRARARPPLAPHRDAPPPQSLRSYATQEMPDLDFLLRRIFPTPPRKPSAARPPSSAPCLPPLAPGTARARNGLKRHQSVGLPPRAPRCVKWEDERGGHVSLDAGGVGRPARARRPGSPISGEGWSPPGERVRMAALSLPAEVRARAERMGARSEEKKGWLVVKGVRRLVGDAVDCFIEIAEEALEGVGR